MLTNCFQNFYYTSDITIVILCLLNDPVGILCNLEGHSLSIGNLLWQKEILNKNNKILAINMVISKFNKTQSQCPLSKSGCINLSLHDSDLT